MWPTATRGTTYRTGERRKWIGGRVFVIVKHSYFMSSLKKLGFDVHSFFKCVTLFETNFETFEVLGDVLQSEAAHHPLSCRWLLAVLYQ